MTSVAAVAITNLLVVRSGRRVLQAISCEVTAGSVTGLLGPSGCGKTTLMRAIVGVQIVESGEIRVLDQDGGAPQLRRRVGYVTQAPSVYRDLSVRENLRYFARVLGADEARIADVIETVSLTAQADRVTGSMSGGQQARASLATALLGEPELLVLDEPTVGLDPVLRRDVWGHFRRLADSGVTMLVSSHVMDEAEHCDELLLMRDGEMIATETPSELRRRTGKQNLEDAFLALIEQRHSP